VRHQKPSPTVKFVHSQIITLGTSRKKLFFLCRVHWPIFGIFCARCLPVLLKVILPLEGLSASLAGERDVILVTPLVDHQVVGFGEATLAVFADELALGTHLASEFGSVGVPILSFYWHNRKHWDDRGCSWAPAKIERGRKSADSGTLGILNLAAREFCWLGPPRGLLALH
jgi:hypothetical protein